ncbi:hypothetical protein DH2020_004353 [Rehmannia glutinosa]|uniref:Zinc knuckle CX2CX4HX4C domain-containing protein n=1 Tax=Rehmannia glutinosa TaxID=99300 RepID=A0ABR0XPD7_REHGL
MFLFQFGSEEDRNLVFNGGPWLFNKQIISLVKQSGAGDIDSMDFNMVHILNLSLVCLKELCLQFVGRSLGEVLSVDIDGVIPRIRVMIDISKPLKMGLWVFLESVSKEFTIPIQFEKLPDFCFSCGMVGHRICECLSKPEKNDTEPPRKFGDWLRANSNNINRQSGRQYSKTTNESSLERASEPSISKEKQSKDNSTNNPESKAK